MQLIIVVETRTSCKSDYKYIKSAIDYYYKERQAQLTPIYAKCKSELIQQDKKIKACKEKYSGNSEVVICADYDRESDPDNLKLVEYCKKHNYKLVWFNLDVEDVFWGYQVNDKDKDNKAEDFLKKKDKLLPGVKGINNKTPLAKRHTSNLLTILDSCHLTRK